MINLWIIMSVERNLRIYHANNNSIFFGSRLSNMMICYFFSILYHCKLNIFEFWTVSSTKWSNMNHSCCCGRFSFYFFQPIIDKTVNWPINTVKMLIRKWPLQWSKSIYQCIGLYCISINQITPQQPRPHTALSAPLMMMMIIQQCDIYNNVPFI